MGTDPAWISAEHMIHAMRKSTMPCCRSGLIGMPRGTFHHFSRQERQQQAQACCATKTGWPRIGVCFPSFCGLAGASRMRMKSSQWRRIVSKPLSDMYFLSAAERRKRLRNFDLPSFRNAASNVRFSGMRVARTITVNFHVQVPVAGDYEDLLLFPHNHIVIETNTYEPLLPANRT